MSWSFDTTYTTHKETKSSRIAETRRLRSEVRELRATVEQLRYENTQLRQSYEDCEVRNMALVAAARTNKEETQ